MIVISFMIFSLPFGDVIKMTDREKYSFGSLSSFAWYLTELCLLFLFLSKELYYY